MSRPRDEHLFRAFADERRLRILHLLQGGEMCVADLVAVLRLPQSTVSRQLGLLRDAGLVEVREDGLWRHYRLGEARSPLHAHLVGCLGSCFGHVPEIQRDAVRAAPVRAGGGCCPVPAQAMDVAASSARSPRSRASSTRAKQRLRK